MHIGKKHKSHSEKTDFINALGKHFCAWTPSIHIDGIPQNKKKELPFGALHFSHKDWTLEKVKKFVAGALDPLVKNNNTHPIGPPISSVLS